MKKYTEEELKQVFKNRSNCYVDSDEVIMGMDEERFIETLKDLKILPTQRAVIGSTSDDDNDNDNWTCGCLYKCNDCTRLELAGESKRDFFERKDLDYWDE